MPNAELRTQVGNAEQYFGIPCVMIPESIHQCKTSSSCFEILEREGECGHDVLEMGCMGCWAGSERSYDGITNAMVLTVVRLSTRLFWWYAVDGYGWGLNGGRTGG
jgi:hypothetical protein